MGFIEGYLIAKALTAEPKVADIECGSWVRYKGVRAVVRDVKYMKVEVGYTDAKGRTRFEWVNAREVSVE